MEKNLGKCQPFQEKGKKLSTKIRKRQGLYAHCLTLKNVE